MSLRFSLVSRQKDLLKLAAAFDKAPPPASVRLQRPSQPHPPQFPTTKQMQPAGNAVSPPRPSCQVVTTVPRHCCHHALPPENPQQLPARLHIKIQTPISLFENQHCHQLAPQPSPHGPSPPRPRAPTPNTGPPLYSKASMSYC